VAKKVTKGKLSCVGCVICTKLIGFSSKTNTIKDNIKQNWKPENMFDQYLLTFLRLCLI